MSSIPLGPFAGDFRMLPNDNTGGRTVVPFSNTPNGIQVLAFFLDRYFTVNTFAVAGVTITDSGKWAYVGIYTLAGALITYGKMSLSAAGFVSAAASVVTTL